MKVSLNAAQWNSNVALAPNGADDLVVKIGAQLGAVEEVIDYSSRYKGIVVARVVSCEKHQGADKLSVCAIDDGGITPDVNRDVNGNVQVVCGAPNVREGLTVAWIPPGATVPATFDKDPFVLEARELRGVVSNGMLASAHELGINGDHSGLLEITASDVGEDLVKPGTEFSNLYGINDTVIDIENKMFTHRPDCFGVLGVGREIAGIYAQQYTSPDWYLKSPVFPDVNNLPLTVENEIPELVPRFMAVAMDNVEIKPSPIWVQALLTRIGVKPINNVVDITNYMAYLTAQPLHAYDYDKVAELSAEIPVLSARFPKEGETITLLNGKTITPRIEAIMIATDKTLIGVGGVMGGADTEVDENTKRIILECVTFDMYSIRRTSMTHGLFTDAVTRNTKGQSPLQNDRVLSKTMEMINELAKGQQASKVIDVNSGLKEPEQVETTSSYINERLGINLSTEEIQKILANVEFESKVNDEKIIIKSPFWRTDIAIPEDVVEEVGRLVGFEKMPHVLPRKTVNPSLVDKHLVLKKSLRQKLASLGANELLTYSFVHENLLQKSSQDNDSAFRLSNALSPDLQYFRLSLTPSLLSNVHPNIKAGYEKFALFEIGKVHSKTELDEENIPREFGRVVVVVADKNSKSGAFYQARAYLDELSGNSLKVEPYSDDTFTEHKLMRQMIAPYEKNRSGVVVNSDNMPVGILGEFSMNTITNFKLPEYSAGLEVFLSALSNHSAKQYMPLSHYPSISQDVCFELQNINSYTDIQKALNEVIHEVLDVGVASETTLIDIYVPENSPDLKRVTFRVKLNSYDRTLQDANMSTVINQVAGAMHSRLGAVRI